MIKTAKRTLKKIYDWAIAAGRSRHAIWALIFVSFFGATFFPFPAEIIMLPIMFAAPRRAWHIATVALVASVAGGISGYFLGYLFTGTGEYLMGMLGYSISDFAEMLDKYGWWVVFAGGLTPFPYKIICVASGVMQINFAVFLTASIISRGLRYYLIAWPIYIYGERARKYIEKHLELISVLLFILLILTAWAFS
ncbi:MAG: DedA family protein [Alphaproteobacteria bacterium]|nr:DedA family protein [Alphaproteobacteria bacterium]